MRLLEAFYQVQAAFHAGGDDIADLRGLLADDIAWHVPGRSPIAGHHHGHQEVLGYFGARRAHAKATFQVLPRAILADDSRRRIWPTASCGPGRPSGCPHSRWKIAECWLVPFDQYLFDELWS